MKSKATEKGRENLAKISPKCAMYRAQKVQGKFAESLQSKEVLRYRRERFVWLRWWAHQDSNLEPRDYESPALTVEL